MPVSTHNTLRPFLALSQDLSNKEQADFIQQLVDEAIDLAIKEDLGTACCDITTQAIVKPGTIANGSVYLKQQATIAGLGVFNQVMRRINPKIEVVATVSDGFYLTSVPHVIARVNGPASCILKAERLALNFLQRMSGIATWTRQFVELAKPYGIDILDTRKTTPTLRAFERYAVTIGGGANHRFGLYDAILVKDNHIKVAGNISSAVSSVRQISPHLTVEVETTTLAEVSEALSCHVEKIMLDNMTPETVREAVKLINASCVVEISGGINLKSLKNYLIPGVNAISVGALTHSAPNVDISLEVEELIC